MAYCKPVLFLLVALILSLPAPPAQGRENGNNSGEGRLAAGEFNVSGTVQTLKIIKDVKDFPGVSLPALVIQTDEGKQLVLVPLPRYGVKDVAGSVAKWTKVLRKLGKGARVHAHALRSDDSERRWLWMSRLVPQDDDDGDPAGEGEGHDGNRVLNADGLDLSGPFPFAATLSLSDGTKVVGRVMSISASEVVVKTAFIQVKLPRKQIKSIETSRPRAARGRGYPRAKDLFSEDFEDAAAGRWSMGKIVRSDEGGSFAEGVLDKGRLQVRSKLGKSRQFWASDGLRVQFRYFVQGPGTSITVVLGSDDGISLATIQQPVQGRWQSVSLDRSRFGGHDGKEKPDKTYVHLLTWFLDGAKHDSRFLLDDIRITRSGGRGRKGKSWVGHRSRTGG